MKAIGLFSKSRGIECYQTNSFIWRDQRQCGLVTHKALQMSDVSSELTFGKHRDKIFAANLQAQIGRFPPIIFLRELSGSLARSTPW